jgi:2-methylaconitate cis-trans-isomerase PrpF
MKDKNYKTLANKKNCTNITAAVDAMTFRKGIVTSY